MPKSLGKHVYDNLANGVSILGILPLGLLFLTDGFGYLIPLIVYNNIMDDLDGILAAKLNIKSEFGAILDNVCDAVAHVVFVMLVAMHYGDVGEDVSIVTVAIALTGLTAATAIVLRVASRLRPTPVPGIGSPTNELIRHLLFALLLAREWGFHPGPVLIATFALHSVSMLVPFRMPYLLRSLTKSATAIGLLNVALVAAWLVPAATPVVAGCFVVSYLCSLGLGGNRWLKSRRSQNQPTATD